MPTIIYGMDIKPKNVQAITLPNSGHYIPEERPDFVIKALDNFFPANSTKTKWSHPITLNTIPNRPLL